MENLLWFMINISQQNQCLNKMEKVIADTWRRVYIHPNGCTIIPSGLSLEVPGSIYNKGAAEVIASLINTVMPRELENKTVEVVTRGMETMAILSFNEFGEIDGESIVYSYTDEEVGEAIRNVSN